MFEPWPTLRFFHFALNFADELPIHVVRIELTLKILRVEPSFAGVQGNGAVRVPLLITLRLSELYAGLSLLRGSGLHSAAWIKEVRKQMVLPSEQFVTVVIGIFQSNAPGSYFGRCGIYRALLGLPRLLIIILLDEVSDFLKELRLQVALFLLLCVPLGEAGHFVYPAPLLDWLLLLRHILIPKLLEVLYLRLEQLLLSRRVLHVALKKLQLALQAAMSRGARLK